MSYWTSQDLGSEETITFQENTKVGWRQSIVHSHISRNQTLVIRAKIYAETDIKVVWSFPILLDFFTLSD